MKLYIECKCGKGLYCGDIDTVNDIVTIIVKEHKCK